MRISDWSSDVCSSDLEVQPPAFAKIVPRPKWPQVRECPCLAELRVVGRCKFKRVERADMVDVPFAAVVPRSEEHTSELQSLMRISYAVFCLKKKKTETAKKNITI